MTNVPNFLQPQVIDKAPESNAKCVCKSNGMERWRGKARIHYVTSISARNVDTSTFLRAPFLTTFLEDFHNIERELISKCPESPFSSKTHIHLARTICLPMFFLKVHCHAIQCSYVDFFAVENGGEEIRGRDTGQREAGLCHSFLFLHLFRALRSIDVGVSV